MEKRSQTPSYLRLIGLVILILLLALAVSPVRPVQAQEKLQTGWVITLLQPTEYEICVGQTAAFIGYFYYNPGPLFPLAPIKGPNKITTRATLGSTSPQNIYSGEPADYFYFTYEGRKEGKDKIVAAIIDDGKIAYEKSVPITVTKKCAYSFQFTAKTRSIKKTADITFLFSKTYTASGKLASDTSADPTKLTGSAQFRMVTDYLNYIDSKCTLFTWSPAYANGHVDVTADISSGNLVKFRISSPKNYDWVFRDEGACDGTPVNVSMEIGPGKDMHDPWVDEVFYPDGGTRQIKIYDLDQSTNVACKKGGMYCDYTAEITLTREKEE